MGTFARNLMLRVAGNPAIIRLFARVGVRSGFARRFIAGETTLQAMRVLRELNSRGILASLDLVGESVKDEEEACRAAEAYIELLQEIRSNQVDSNISIKLTQLGLAISQEICAVHLKAILASACELENFVRIDMEDSRYTQATLELFREHYEAYDRRVGVVIQSYLYRSAEDVRNLMPLGCNIRLCKGAYMEPATVAFPSKEDVDRNFIKLLEMLLPSSTYTAIATHDEKMIRHAQWFIARNHIEGCKYEFQMLYGIRPDLQLRLHKSGFKIRVYVPFGRHWALYFMRRLAERPANIMFLLRHLLRK